MADEGDRLFSKERLNGIRFAQNQISKIKEVKSATAFIDVYRPSVVRRTMKGAAQRSAVRVQLKRGQVPDVDLRPVRYWPIEARVQARINLNALREKALDDDRIVGKFLSADGTKHLILIALHPEESLSLPRQQSLCKEIRQILSKNNVGLSGIHMGGLPVANAAVGEEIQSAFLKLLPYGFAAVALLIFCIYRDFRVAILSAAIGAISVVWSLGITSLVYGEITILVAASPLVVLAISTTDFLHIATAWQLAWSKSAQSKEQVLMSVFEEVGGACVLTSTTTFIGFASLLFTYSSAVRQFGFACAVGTSVALLLMITLLPIAFRGMSPLSLEIGKNPIYRIVDLILERCKGIAKSSSGIVLVITFLLCVLGVWAIVGKPLDADLPRRFPEKHDLNQSLRVMENEFIGVNSIELYVSGAADKLLSHATCSELKDFEKSLDGHPLVLKVISILDLFRGVDDSISYHTDDRLPPSVAAGSASVDWISEIEPEFVDSLITNDKDSIRIRVMVRSIGVRETNRLADDLENKLGERLGPEISVTAGGTYSIIGNALTEIVKSQMFSFAVCVVSLTLVMAWGLGSLRVAIMAQIPNLVPVLLMIGVVAFSLERIDTDLLGLPMIGLGIAVDDTIHFLNRFHLAGETAQDRDKAIDRVFKTTGRSIVLSTLVLCVGLSPLAFSQIISLWMLGTFLVVGVFGALVADLLCLPAMIQMGLFKFRREVLP